MKNAVVGKDVFGHCAELVSLQKGDHLIHSSIHDESIGPELGNTALNSSALRSARAGRKGEFAYLSLEEKGWRRGERAWSLELSSLPSGCTQCMRPGFPVSHGMESEQLDSALLL